MASLTIVAGCPGTGKTTLASQLSTANPRGLPVMAPELRATGVPVDSHAVETSGRTSLETFAEVERRRAAGELRLDLTESLEA